MAQRITIIVLACTNWCATWTLVSLRQVNHSKRVRPSRKELTGISESPQMFVLGILDCPDQPDPDPSSSLGAVRVVPENTCAIPSPLSQFHPRPDTVLSAPLERLSSGGRDD
jgi:hypothetical protein